MIVAQGSEPQAVCRQPAKQQLLRKLRLRIVLGKGVINKVRPALAQGRVGKHRRDQRPVNRLLFIRHHAATGVQPGARRPPYRVAVGGDTGVNFIDKLLLQIDKYRINQFILAGKVVLQTAFADAGSFHHFIQRQAAQAFPGNNFCRTLEQRLPKLFRRFWTMVCLCHL